MTNRCRPGMIWTDTLLVTCEHLGKHRVCNVCLRAFRENSLDKMFRLRDATRTFLLDGDIAGLRSAIAIVESDPNLAQYRRR